MSHRSDIHFSFKSPSILYMSLIGVTEAAHRLRVSPQRIYQRIADGTLFAARVGNQWAIDETALGRVNARLGRPLSERAAWAILALELERVGHSYAPDVMQGLSLSPSELSRARKRFSKILSSDEPEELLRAWLPRRAERLIFRASPRDLGAIGSDCHLLVSGLSHASSGMTNAGVVEGYIARADLADFIDRHLLIEAPDGRANVFLHVVNMRPPSASLLLVAADLADHYGPRESSRVRSLVKVLR